MDIPAAAREKSDKGAEAFVRFFMQQAAAAWTIPDATLIEQQSDPDNCSACRDLAKVARSLEAPRSSDMTCPLRRVAILQRLGGYSVRRSGGGV